MRTLIAPTEDFIKVERSTLASDVASGSSVTLVLENNNGFSENEFIVIGREGSEDAELQQINAAVSGASDVQVATLDRDHKRGEPVVRYRYNQRKFYGATSAGGSYTELTGDGSPVDIQVDDPQGTRLEYTGSTFTHFKSTYYNSQTTDETTLDDSDAAQGDQSGRYTSIYAIRKQAGLTENPYITDGYIEEKRRQAENEINSSIFANYELPLSEVPDLITNVCTLLAAGYIDFAEFGRDGEGVKWLGEARGILKALRNGTQRLIKNDGTELERKSRAGVIDGFPDGSIDERDRDARQFKLEDRY